MVSLADCAEVLPHVLVSFLDKESVLLNLETERFKVGAPGATPVSARD